MPWRGWSLENNWKPECIFTLSIIKLRIGLWRRARISWRKYTCDKLLLLRSNKIWEFWKEKVQSIVKFWVEVDLSRAFSICRTLLYIPLSRKLAADVILYNRVDFLSLIADLLWTCHPDTLDNLENCRTDNHENEECY